jgi:integrase
MDQSQLLSIVGGIYDKLVADVSDAVIAKLKAENSAAIALEPDNLRGHLIDLLAGDDGVRDTIRDLIDVKIDDIDLDNYRQFISLEARVDELESNDSSAIDADNDTFADAVCEVIRNKI